MIACPKRIALAVEPVDASVGSGCKVPQEVCARCGKAHLTAFAVCDRGANRAAEETRARRGVAERVVSEGEQVRANGQRFDVGFVPAGTGLAKGDILRWT